MSKGDIGEISTSLGDLEKKEVVLNNAGTPLETNTNKEVQRVLGSSSSNRIVIKKDLLGQDSLNKGEGEEYHTISSTGKEDKNLESLLNEDLKVKKVRGGYEIELEPSIVFKELEERIDNLGEGDISGAGNLSSEYGLTLGNKTNLKNFVKSYKESFLGEYEKSEELSGLDLLVYKEKEPVEYIYSLKGSEEKETASEFNVLKKKVPALRDISYKKSKEEYTYKGEVYNLEELRRVEEGKFRYLKKEGSVFSYTVPKEETRYSKSEELLGTEGIPELEERKGKEKVNEGLVIVEFMGNRSGLSYSDYGYILERYKVGEDEGEKFLDIRYNSIIGGENSCKEEEIIGEKTFRGKVLGNVKEQGKGNEILRGDVEYKLHRDKSKEIEIKFEDWYEIGVSSISGNEEGYNSVWDIRGEAGEGKPQLKKKEGVNLGYIKGIEYYGPKEKVESVGILEYKDAFSTTLTLTFGAK